MTPDADISISQDNTLTYWVPGSIVIEVLCHNEETDRFTVELCDVMVDVRIEKRIIVETVVPDDSEYTIAAAQLSEHYHDEIVGACMEFRRQVIGPPAAMTLAQLEQYGYH